MSLLEMLGAGGGVLDLELASETVQAGGVVEGTVCFTGGERTQTIERLVIELTCTITSRQGLATSKVLPETVIAERFTSKEGEKQTFPFRFQLSPAAPASAIGSVDYTLDVSAEIDGEIDPSADARLIVAPVGMSLPVTSVGRPAAASWPDTCQKCGAPLDPPPAGASSVDCKFCHRRHSPIDASNLQ
jgi:sporulation-control protein spo0M